MENKSVNDGVKLEDKLDKVKIPEFRPSFWIKALRAGAWVLAVLTMFAGICIGAMSGWHGAAAAFGAVVGLIIGIVVALFELAVIMVYLNLAQDIAEIKKHIVEK